MPASKRYQGPAELTLRVGTPDEKFVRRLYGLAPGTRPAPYRPGRLVVNAHVPLSAKGVAIAASARQAGVPFLVDPETTYLQDYQHPAAEWSAVPFAVQGAQTPADLMSTASQDDLVRQVVDYQIAHGASAVIAPYVHVEKPDSGWIRVQAGLWRRTALYLEAGGINLPVIAVVATGWRCLHPLRGVPGLGEMWNALSMLEPSEVALAASKVHAGTNPADRIVELLMLVDNFSRTYSKVTMWQQGLLGEACVIEGAAGYECGIGWREKCDLQAGMARYRRPSTGHPAARPVYIAELGRSVPKKRLGLARNKRKVWARLVCPFADCCAPGGDDLLGDARMHSVVTRARELEQLDATRATRWRWNRLTQRMAAGIALANDLNALATPSSGLPGVETRSMHAIWQVANARRGRRGRVRRTA
jgi:hypothetical protein